MRSRLLLALGVWSLAFAAVAENPAAPVTRLNRILPIEGLPYVELDGKIHFKNNADRAAFAAELTLPSFDVVASLAGHTGDVTLADLSLVVGTHLQGHSTALDRLAGNSGAVDLSGVTLTLPPAVVITGGSYADPPWITSLAKSKVSLGNVSNTASSGTFSVGNGSITFGAAGQISAKTDPTNLQTLTGNANSNTVQLADAGSNVQTMLALLTGQAVMPQSFGALGDGNHDDTSAVQATINTGRNVYSPEGIYKLTAALNKSSVGQSFLGAGPNRTIFQQTTTATNFLNVLAIDGSSPAAFKWRGLYNPGGGAYLHEIGGFSVETTHANTGRGINVDGGDTFFGDYLHIHDVNILYFNTQIYIRSVAHVELHRLRLGGEIGSPCDRGLYIPGGANPNSFILEGVSCGGVVTGAEVHGLGMKLSFGDMVGCTTALKLYGSGHVSGDHIESCTVPIKIGTAGDPGSFVLDAVNMLVDPMGTSPIELDGGSTATGSVVGGAPNATTPLVLCHTEYDQACLVNLSTASDFAHAHPEAFQFQAANGKVRRFPTFLQVQQENRMDTVSGDASLAGQFFIINNGSGTGADQRIVFEYEKSDGSFAWGNIIAESLLAKSSNTWSGDQIMATGKNITLSTTATTGGHLTGALVYPPTTGWAASKSFLIQANADGGGDLCIYQSTDSSAPASATYGQIAKWDTSGVLNLQAGLAVTGIAVISGNATASNFKRGAGSPEGAVVGIVGDLFTRTDGGASTTLYVKESGTGNTGWVAK